MNVYSECVFEKNLFLRVNFFFFFFRKVNDEKMNTYKDFCKSLDNKDLFFCLMRDLKVSLFYFLVIFVGIYICVDLFFCVWVNIIYVC